MATLSWHNIGGGDLMLSVLHVATAIPMLQSNGDAVAAAPPNPMTN